MPSNVLVVCVGLGTVFFGLISLIVICSIMGAVCKGLVKNEKPQPTAVPVQSAPAAPIANKQELVAACCAVIAEELGTQAQNIRVVSFKRV